MDTPVQQVPQPSQPVQWGRVGSLVGGQASVQLGSFALLIAMNWTAVELGGTRAVTLLMLAATVPRALMLIFGGAVADTLGPRFILLRTTAARVVLLAAGAVVTATAHQLWPLVVIALVEGILLGLAGPASGVLLPMFARGDQLARANSLYAMVLRVAPILGAPAGALLITVGELWLAMLVGAVTGAIWLGCLLHVTHGFVRPKPEPGVSLVKRSGDGFRLLAAHPGCAGCSSPPSASTSPSAGPRRWRCRCWSPSAAGASAPWAWCWRPSAWARSAPARWAPRWRTASRCSCASSSPAPASPPESS